MRRVKAGALLRAIKEACLLTQSQPGDPVYLAHLQSVFMHVSSALCCSPYRLILLHLVCINPNCTKHPRAR